ncbi:triose-phosphate isomerase [Simiduia sp. 21SJ11W-1]|uniref:triose-phosphate isomerase n=1 Tax=Simiduia sp. 21SJ11W-1 TaxID=2909669 RepID=UPI00209D6010|nr:triose-phosphate isomerase [Simiduia sp. 21SJ11W-1]UTA47026.1 triose-phosphate isomerase [Simiduia sp. 21SJ11W-1]
MRRPLVMGNWKMNGSHAANAQWLEGFRIPEAAVVDVAIAAPAPYLAVLSERFQRAGIALAAQDVSDQLANGAFTGQCSGAMLKDVGCEYAIVGHSERREYQAESDALVAAKTKAALAAGVTPVVCVGETLTEREQEQTFAVVARQLAAVIEAVEDVSEIVVAYEPVWAIGTGKTATPEQAQAVHAAIREQLGSAGSRVSVLYGGSVKSANADELFKQPDIDGALVGGAALDSVEFSKICESAISHLA